MNSNTYYAIHVFYRFFRWEGYWRPNDNETINLMGGIHFDAFAPSMTMLLKAYRKSGDKRFHYRIHRLLFYQRFLDPVVLPLVRLFWGLILRIGTKKVAE